GLYLHTDAMIDAPMYEHLRFWIHAGDTGGQRIGVALLNENGEWAAAAISIAPQAGRWTCPSPRPD
ncbi:MAG TPA: hypothetical protein VER55_13710, partial [Ardenticatenaceae bacterium]|nr:hypothetical protein [Ardenticatenaceae bacterium]